ncbi:MAG TPA: hypothetical protein VGO50_11860 [Pyrinomonadaceae bacterium]|jgi:hypothetical protein|nr:hypothetical protein [Pyrinomonadaceae bacterium]
MIPNKKGIQGKNAATRKGRVSLPEIKENDRLQQIELILLRGFFIVHMMLVFLAMIIKEIKDKFLM